MLDEITRFKPNMAGSELTSTPATGPVHRTPAKPELSSVRLEQSTQEMSFQEETVSQEELDDIKRWAKEAALEYE